MRRLPILLAILAACVLIEPNVRDKTTFAIIYVVDPPTSYERQFSRMSADPNLELVEYFSPSAKAPEPGTFVVILSGILGMVIRFVRKSFERLKRLMDIALSVIAITFCLPVLAFVALLIKLTSPGPIVYTQRRVGKDGNIFRIYKLRTMRSDAEKTSGAVWAQENDPRITPIGRILRKSHFDEVLQFYNVLKGDMSIVGPRPERPEIVTDLAQKVGNYDKRLIVKPGITGLSQVRWSYDETIEDVKKKVKYDLLYIKKMCVMFDLRIMAKTFVVMTTGRGAH